LGKTKIEWATDTWNPVTGCTKVSPGCKNCYAERLTERFGRRFDQIVLHPERLDAPLRWRKPRRVFVNSMSDLFHEEIPDEFIDKVFRQMQKARQHTFQILTKRPERMKEFLLKRVSVPWGGYTFPEPWGHRIWLGVSVENQECADLRIPALLQTSATVRFVSAEPLLASIDLREYLTPCDDPLCDDHRDRLGGLDWVIVGGESGPGARPMDLSWARGIVRQCHNACVPCFVKQLGAAASDPTNGIAGRFLRVPQEAEALISRRLRDGKGGDPSEWPEDLRVREWPR